MPLRSLPVLAIAVLLLPAVHGSDTAPPDEADAALAAEVAAFLESFIDPGNSPREQAAYFAEGVDYYEQGPASRALIAKDIARYSRRWPWRAYRLARVDYITPDAATGQVFVSYAVDFEVGNRTRVVRGRANYGAVISGLDSEPRIVWIRENITGRARDTIE
ncbi:MAG TPA: hypothetical protein VIM12_12015 [Noviherbaspirillum sp.]|jgi:hypothetical protein|uniref:hypothetical protein n=1 Tax=Noviherbaspirillum sp. TaxID=1926288 RepID=UPI002F95ED97